MEGLTAETSSLDGSRQTNYIRLLPLVDGDSLTQPAFGNLTYAVGPSSSTIVKAANSCDTAVQNVAPTYVVPNSVFPAPGSDYDVVLIPSLPESQVMLAYDLGDGRYAIGGNIESMASTRTVCVVQGPGTSDAPGLQPEPNTPLGPEISSSATSYSPTNQCDDPSTLDNASDQRLAPLSTVPSFDTEAQLEAPQYEQNQILVLIGTPPGSSRLRPAPTMAQERLPRRKRKRNHGATDNGPSDRGGWPKGKKRKKTHPRLKEPSAPATAYVIYSRERRPLLKIENPDISNAELTKIVGNEWTTLSKIDKRKYSQKAAQDLERYKKELSEYQRSPEYQAFLRDQRDLKQQPRLGATSILPGPSSSTVDHTLDDANATVSGVESSGLYCADCDIYFISEHNKSEHMRSQKHRRKTLGEFSNYLTVKASKCSRSTDGQPYHEDLLSNEDTVPDPVDVEEFIVQFMIKDRERSLELSELRNRVRAMQTEVAGKKSRLASLMERHETQKRNTEQKLQQRLICEQQLANLRAIPLLFETEDFLT